MSYCLPNKLPPPHSPVFVLGEFLKNSIPVADFSIEFPVGPEYITREYADWLKTLRFQ